MEKNLPTNAGDVRDWGSSLQVTGWEDPLEKCMTTHCSILAWRIPQTEDPGRLRGHTDLDTTEATQHAHAQWTENGLLNLMRE